MRTNNVLSYLALCHQLADPAKAHHHNRYAHIFQAHIGSLYREAKHTGTEAEVDALVGVIYAVEVWPALQGEEETKELKLGRDTDRDEAFEVGEERGEESKQGPKANQGRGAGGETTTRRGRPCTGQAGNKTGYSQARGQEAICGRRELTRWEANVKSIGTTEVK